MLPFLISVCSFGVIDFREMAVRSVPMHKGANAPWLVQGRIVGLFYGKSCR